MDAERGTRPRHAIRTPVAYWGADFEGGGTLANISLSGALIEPASPAVVPGTQLTVSVPYFPRTHVELRSVELRSRVVRSTDCGFAVLFHELAPEASQVLGELAFPEVIDLTDEI
ncbi:MAG: PilZ domain-containing protein [Myxococcota bacterium]